MRKFSVSILVFVFLLVVGGTSVFAANDGSDINHPIIAGEGTFSDVLVNGNAKWYSFYSDSTGKNHHWVVAVQPPQGQDFGIIVYKGYEVIASSNNSGDTMEVVSIEGYGDEQYKFVIYPVQGGYAPNPYTLIIHKDY